MFDLVNIFQNLSKSIKLRFVSELITKLSNFLIVIVITRSLGIEDYGFYVILLTIIYGILPFLSLGLNSTVIKKLSSTDDVDEITTKIFNCLKLKILFFLFLLIIVLSFLSFQFKENLLIGVLALISSFSISLQMIFFEVLRSKYLSNNFSYLQILDSILFLILLLFMHEIKFINIELILIVFIIVKIFISASIFLILKRKSIIKLNLTRQPTNLIKNYIKPGIIFVILGISDWFINFSDKLIIGYYLDSLQLSVYFTIGLISSSILSLGSIYWWELLPKLNEYQSKNKYDKIFKLIKGRNESFIYLSNILIIILIIFSPLIQGLMLNENIKLEIFFYLFFFMSIFFHQISTGWEFFCYIEDKGSFVLKNSVFWGIFSFILYFILIPIYGMYGALITLFLSKTFSSLCLKKFANKNGYKDKIIARSLLNYLIPFIFSLSLFIILNSLKLINLGEFLNSVLCAFICIICFCKIDNLIKNNNLLKF